MFKVSDHGFTMVIRNYRISVEFGPRNYCDNHEGPAEVRNCKNAEIAIFNSIGSRLRLDERDSVRGYVNSDNVARIIGYLATSPSESEVIRFVSELFRYQS